MQFLHKGLSLVSMKDCLMLLLVLGIFCRLFALHKYALCFFISLQVLMELTGTIVLKLVFLWFKYLKKFHAFNHNRPCMFVASFFYCLMYVGLLFLLLHSEFLD